MREIASAGGQATRAKFAAPGLRAGEMPELTDIESCKRAYNVVAQALAERRITDKEALGFVRIIDGFVKAESAAITQRVVTELQAMHEAKDEEIAELRRQVGGARVRVAK